MPTWKKIIVSGSNAELNQITGSNTIGMTGGNQIITTSHVGTKLSGSFSGSFFGDGTNLIGVTATPTFPTSVKTDLASSDKFFVNDDAGNGTVGNKQITYSNLLADIAGTSATTNLVVLETNDSIGLASSITGISNFQATSITGSTITGSFTGSFSGTINSNNGVLSGSSLSSPAQGQVRITTNGVDQSAIDLGLETGDTPTFAGIASNGATFGIATSTATTINIGTTDATNVSIGKSGTSTVTVNNDLRVVGDLVVEGDVVEMQVTNLNVEDQFILLASGSAGSLSAGIIAPNSVFPNTGSAFIWDTLTKQWGFKENVAASSTAPGSLLHFATMVSQSIGKPTSAPIYGTGVFVDSQDGDIWFYS